VEVMMMMEVKEVVVVYLWGMEMMLVVMAVAAMKGALVRVVEVVAAMGVTVMVGL
jgi:hypothetical protein